MTKKDKNLLLALAMGDGCIYRPTDKRKLRANFRINHSVKQSEYLEWKKAQVERILDVSINTHFQTCEDGSGSGKKHGVIFFSKTHRYFAILRKYLYRSGKKGVPIKAFNRIDDLGLAILYLDDGNLYKRKDCANGYQLEIAIATPEGDAIAIAKIIKKRWDIDFLVHKLRDTGLYRLRCGTKEALKFLDIVRPYVLNEIQALQYKVIV